MRREPIIEKNFIGGDFSGPIGTTSNGFDNVHGGLVLGKGTKVGRHS